MSSTLGWARFRCHAPRRRTPATWPKARQASARASWWVTPCASATSISAVTPAAPGTSGVAEAWSCGSTRRRPSPSSRRTAASACSTRRTACASRPASCGRTPRKRTPRCTSTCTSSTSSRHDMSDDHGHHPVPLSDVERRALALEELLVEKGLVRPEFIDQVVEAYARDIGPMNGDKVVARAWVDPDYKERLLANGTAAIAELGLGGPEGDHLVAVENK